MVVVVVLGGGVSVIVCVDGLVLEAVEHRVADREHGTDRGHLCGGCWWLVVAGGW